MSIPFSTDEFSGEGVSRDDAWMQRALALAEKGVGLAHPNPVVGCVIEKDGTICGEGFHRYEQRDHAEVVALRVAGEEARGATLYVTLEPCCHTGRTGPCTNAIIAGGLRRVIVAILDPNPRVAGKGVAQLRAAGIDVTVGVGEEQARALNVDFAKWIRTGQPLVTLKAALTLDGSISAKAGESTEITNSLSRAAVQKLRHEADAILTGIGTVLTDDPQLTDRTGMPRRLKLQRVIVDSKLRLPLKSKIARSAEGDVLVFTTREAPATKVRALVKAGVEVVRVRAVRGRVDFQSVLKMLGTRQILNLLVEAGSEVNGAALESGIVDRMILFYAPKIIGAGGVPMATLPARNFAKAPALKNIRFRQYGSDFAIEGYFHDVYGDHRARRKN